MRVTGLIFALDLATACGFAAGRPGETPRSGSVVLKKRDEHRGQALGNLIEWLRREWTDQRPELIVKEAPMPLQAFADRANSEDAVVMTYGLHGVTEAMAARFGIRVEQAHPSTIRKHFTGRGRFGSRDDTKRAVIERARLLKLIPADCSDDNRADAVAAWDWAAATFGQRSASTASLHLFGEVAPRV